MRSWLWLAPVVLLAGCSRMDVADTAAQTPPAAETPAPAPYASEIPELVAPRGATLRIRVEEPLNTLRNRTGDAFRATLASPVLVDGRTVIPAGTRFTGRVTDASPSGRLEGRAILGLEMESFELEGKSYHIQTNSLRRLGAPHKTRDIGFIAGGSGLAAVIGALAGGGKGAAVGALAGAGAGTAAAAATGKQDIGLPAESVVTFSLEAPVKM
jgi:hypothetical protein